MGKFEKTIYKLLAGSSDNNFKFEELRNILFILSFEERIASSHHIFKKKGCVGIINLQPKSQTISSKTSERFFDKQ